MIGANPIFRLVNVDINALSYDSVHPGSFIIEANRFGWMWKVRAKIAAEFSEFSKTRTFDVEPVNTDPPSS